MLNILVIVYLFFQLPAFAQSPPAENMSTINCVFAGNVPFKKVNATDIQVLTDKEIKNADLTIKFEKVSIKKNATGSIEAFFTASPNSPDIATGKQLSFETKQFKFETTVRMNKNGRTYKITNQPTNSESVPGMGVARLTSFANNKVSGYFRMTLPMTFKETNIQKGGVLSIKVVKNGKVSSRCDFKDIELKPELETVTNE